MWRLYATKHLPCRSIVICMTVLQSIQIRQDKPKKKKKKYKKRKNWKMENLFQLYSYYVLRTRFVISFSFFTFLYFHYIFAILHWKMNKWKRTKTRKSRMQWKWKSCENLYRIWIWIRKSVKHNRLDAEKKNTDSRLKITKKKKRKNAGT